jgi:DNA-binding NarL/FixJ family response regulator
MNTSVEPSRLKEQLNVLLVGNNPIELSSMLNKISDVPGRLVNTETAFDTKSILDRLIKFRPNFILIDDNIGKHELNETVLALANNRKTKDVPITVLKNSNYAEANSSLTILDYILKKSLTAEALYNAIRNTIKIRRTQLYLYKAYHKRRGMIVDLLRGK